MSRIACLLVPDFRLYATLQALGGEPLSGLALVDPQDGRRRIVAASPAARQDGVTRGMTAVAAAALAPELTVREIDYGALAETHRALEVAVRRVTPVFESTGCGVLYASYDGLDGRYEEDGIYGFIDDLRDAARGLGLPARVGVAGNRFAARCAAASEGLLPARGRVIVVPDGDEAAFLAPLSTRLLPESVEMVAELERLSVTTLGGFAALPEGGVAERWGPRGALLQRLARGEDRGTLIPMPEPRAFVVRIDVDDPISTTEALRFVLRGPIEHLCADLSAEGRAASEMALTLWLSGSEPLAVPVPGATPSCAPKLWSELIAVACDSLCLQGPVVRVEIAARRIDRARGDQQRIVGPKRAPAGALSRTLAHLAAELRDGAFGVLLPQPEVEPRERASIRPFIEEDAARRREGWTPDRRSPGALGLACRRVEPSEPVDVDAPRGVPRAVRHRGGVFPVSRAHGPFRTSSSWWSTPQACTAFLLEGRDGAMLVADEGDGFRLTAWID